MAEVYTRTYSLPAGLGEASITVNENLTNKIQAFGLIGQGLKSGSPGGIAGAALGFASLMPGFAPLAVVGGIISNLIGDSDKPSIAETTLNAVNKVGEEVVKQSAIIQDTVLQVGNQIQSLILQNTAYTGILQPIIYNKLSELNAAYNDQVNQEMNRFNQEILVLQTEQNQLTEKINENNTLLKSVYDQSINSIVQILQEKLSAEQNALFDSLNNDIDKLEYLKKLELEIETIKNFNITDFAVNILRKLRELLILKGFQAKGLIK